VFFWWITSPGGCVVEEYRGFSEEDILGAIEVNNLNVDIVWIVVEFEGAELFGEKR
jgi:hypothetical protein